MGRYGTENSLFKVTKHFSLLLDGKLICTLRCSGYVIFWLGDWIAKCRFKNVAVFAEIAKFNAFATIQCYRIRTCVIVIHNSLLQTSHGVTNVLLLKQCHFHSDAHDIISIDFRVLLYHQWLK